MIFTVNAFRVDKMKKDNFFTKPVAVIFLAIFACALWGSAFPAIKIGFALMNIETAGSKILYAGCRFMTAGIMTLMIASVVEKRFVIIKKSSLPAVCVQGLLQTTLQYICFYIGLSFTTGAKASVINGSNTFFSIIAAHFLIRGERINFRKTAGCIIGFVGIIVANMKEGSLSGDFNLIGEGMILLCSAAYGVSSVTLKLFSDRETPGALSAYQLILGSSVLIIIGLLLGGSLEGFTAKSFLLLFYLSLLSTTAFYLWATLLKYNPVSRITVFGLTIPIFGVLFSSAILGEKVFNITNIVSLLLVCAGIVIVNYVPGQNKADTKSE